ncbi:hypothetical protein [Sansalvadorimonas verongulae]|uniref:hypothetical protein n=1 Tax=Sansalvadorimonas verongulae TaxID=2172824 RepID=UPI0012BBEDD3|nr:hypothetical protein [Sansalvadorimonas verongulae]MTI13642.1 hypothetical protein [Sansalvadorimonas verongulae]
MIQRVNVKPNYGAGSQSQQTPPSDKQDDKEALFVDLLVNSFLSSHRFKTLYAKSDYRAGSQFQLTFPSLKQKKSSGPALDTRSIKCSPFPRRARRAGHHSLLRRYPQPCQTARNTFTHTTNDKEGIALSTETYLSLSIYHFKQLIGVEEMLPEDLPILGKAFNCAALAVESSGGTNASCLNQLAHCFHFLTTWPQLDLETFGIEEKKAHEFRQTSALLFDQANKLESRQQKLKKDEP